MHFKGELSALVKRMLPEELLERILSAYREELEREGCPDSERDYAAGRQALEAALDEGQRAQLASMEEMGRRNLRLRTAVFGGCAESSFPHTGGK